MIGKKPKKKDNLVSMPLDKDYRNGFRGKAQEPEPVEENEYINKKAEDALKSLRAL